MEEIADVHALSALVTERFNLDTWAMAQRSERKKAMKRAWFKMLEDDRE